MDYSLEDFFQGKEDAESSEEIDLLQNVLDSAMCQIANGLKHIHAQNVVHQDVKPQNILLKQESSTKYIAKLADFGASEIIGEKRERKSRRAFSRFYSGNSC